MSAKHAACFAANKHLYPSQRWPNTESCSNPVSALFWLGVYKHFVDDHCYYQFVTPLSQVLLYEDCLHLTTRLQQAGYGSDDSLPSFACAGKKVLLARLRQPQYAVQALYITVSTSSESASVHNLNISLVCQASTFWLLAMKGSMQAAQIPAVTMRWQQCCPIQVCKVASCEPAGKYLLAICEGNHCQGGRKGRDSGNGRILVAKLHEDRNGNETCRYDKGHGGPQCCTTHRGLPPIVKPLRA